MTAQEANDRRFDGRGGTPGVGACARPAEPASAPPAPRRRLSISVVHHSLDLLGSGERVCMSLLAALDRTAHDVELRCVKPPPGVAFAGDPAPGGGGRGPAAGAPASAFGKVRLARIPPGGGPERGQSEGGEERANFGAEVRALFGARGRDLVVVTDEGFIMEQTDAPRVVWYCNSALRHESGVLGLPQPRHPRRMLALRRTKAQIQQKIALARAEKVVIVPNSESTRRAVAKAVGRDDLGPTLHPPVDVARFLALRGIPKERRVATVARFAPEKNLARAMRIAGAAGCGHDVVGNTLHGSQASCLEEVRAKAPGDASLHVNVGQDILEEVVGRAKVYLHTSEESFGVAVAEAIAAGCVPIVPDNSAHPETVPFDVLRYGTEAEAVAKVKKALDGGYDDLLPALERHVRRFSVAAFQEAMMGVIEGHASTRGAGRATEGPRRRVAPLGSTGRPARPPAHGKPPLRVSIIIPVYNAQDYLDECIASALDQTHADTEIVAVDDGSTDDSAEILRGYSDRISVYCKPNGGTASALNHARIRMAGDWFKWLSADDLLKPHAVEALVSGAARAGGRSEDCIFYADHEYVGPGGEEIKTVHRYNGAGRRGDDVVSGEEGDAIGSAWSLSADYNRVPPVHRAAILLDHFFGNGITTMFHRSLFGRCGGFDESLGFDEDYEFWLRCCLVHGCEMRYVDSVVATSRVHGTQLSAVHSGKSGAAKEAQIREHILGMLAPRQRRRYLSALADYRYGPRRVRARRRVRDAVLGSLPGGGGTGVAGAYMNAKRRIRGTPQR